MKFRGLALAMVLALASTACQNSNSPSNRPSDGGVAAVVGAWCSSEQVTAAVRQGTGWHVTVYWDKTTYRDVAGTDRVVRRQEVRSCITVTCDLSSGLALTSQGAIDYCARVAP